MNFRPHARYEALLGAFVLGEAPEAEREVVLSHARGCRSCREALEGASRLTAVFRDIRRKECWAPSVHARVGGRLDAARRARFRSITYGLGAMTALSLAFNAAFASGSLAPIGRMLRDSAPGRFAVVHVRAERERLGAFAVGASATASARWETRLALLASAGFHAAARGSMIEREIFNHSAPVDSMRVGYQTGALSPEGDEPAGLTIDLAVYRPAR